MRKIVELNNGSTGTFSFSPVITLFYKLLLQRLVSAKKRTPKMASLRDILLPFLILNLHNHRVLYQHSPIDIDASLMGFSMMARSSGAFAGSARTRRSIQRGK